MAQRNDLISLWWPGSPQDRPEFWSKPVLTVLADGAVDEAVRPRVGARAAEPDGRRSGAPSGRCACRTSRCRSPPSGRVWQLVLRLAGRRAGALAALVLATSSQWAFITRQAMTDMPFVAPMTIALALRRPRAPRARGGVRGAAARAASCASGCSLAARDGVLGLLRALRSARCRSSSSSRCSCDGRQHPRLSTCAPSASCRCCSTSSPSSSASGGARARRTAASSTCSPPTCSVRAGDAGQGAGRHRAARHRARALSRRRRPLARHLSSSSRCRAASCSSSPTAFPWYHAMLIRHGAPFWSEFIGDNYVHRAAGRHGDRGTFEYYLQ